FFRLFAPVADLIGAERHRAVDALDVVVGQRGELRKGRDPLLPELSGRDRPDTLDRGQLVALALRRLEQGCRGFLCLRRGRCRLGLLRGGLLRRSGPSGQDFGDTQRGQELPMSALAARILPPPLLEGNYLLAAYWVPR